MEPAWPPSLSDTMDAEALPRVIIDDLRCPGRAGSLNILGANMAEDALRAHPQPKDGNPRGHIKINCSGGQAANVE